MAKIIELHSLCLAHKVVSDTFFGFPEPIAQVLIQMEAQPFCFDRDFFTDVETVGDLPAEDGDDSSLFVEIDLVLSRQLRPVDVVSVVAVVWYDEGSNATSFGNDVGSGQRCDQIEAGIDLFQ